MIEWNMALTKPAINTADLHDLKNGVSFRVVARITEQGGFCGHAFARYNHQSESWMIEGFLGGCYDVSHWTSLNEPEN
jgi:hypothetical protein